jgi:hypothetical protein
MATGAERQAKWKARHVAEVARLRQIAAQVARLIDNKRHSRADAPIVKRLEKVLREVSI